MAANVKNVAKSIGSNSLVVNLFKNVSLNIFKPKPNAVPLITPYTLTAAYIQYPHVKTFKEAWMIRYLVYANIMLMPLWLWIDSKVNSPEAKLAWEKKKRDDFIKEHKKEWEI